MPETSREIQELLTREDNEFRQWHEEHHQYEGRLAELASKAVLSPEEEFEEKQIKKRKLFLKDMMAARIRSHESTRATASA